MKLFLHFEISNTTMHWIGGILLEVVSTEPRDRTIKMEYDVRSQPGFIRRLNDHSKGLDLT